MCSALSPASHFQPPSRTCSTPCTTDTATTLDSLACPPASVASALLGSPVRSPQPPPRSRGFCCSPQVPGTPDQISDEEVRIPRLHGTFPPQPSAHAAAPSPADSADEVLLLRFSHCAALVLCDGDAEEFLPRPGVSCLSSSPSPSIVRPQPALQAGGRGRCPLGMVNSDLLLFLLLPCLRPSAPSCFQFCSEMLLLTSDWSHYHRCLNIHLAVLRIHPSSPVSSRVPSSHLYTDVLFLLDNPRGFEAPPLGTPVAALTRCWLDICRVYHIYPGSGLAYK
jgi:hypothetical protein